MLWSEITGTVPDTRGTGASLSQLLSLLQALLGQDRLQRKTVNYKAMLKGLSTLRSNLVLKEVSRKLVGYRWLCAILGNERCAVLPALGSEEGEQQLGVGVNLPPASSCDAHGTGTASVCVFETPKHHARPACATPASKTLAVVPLRVLALN